MPPYGESRKVLSAQTGAPVRRDISSPVPID